MLLRAIIISNRAFKVLFLYSTSDEMPGKWPNLFTYLPQATYFASYRCNVSVGDTFTFFLISQDVSQIIFIVFLLN